jgi:hypothetical protein
MKQMDNKFVIKCFESFNLITNIVLKYMDRGSLRNLFGLPIKISLQILINIMFYRLI